MKKWISRMRAVCLLLGLTACGEQPEGKVSQSETSQSVMENNGSVDITNEEKLQNVQETDGEHILIAYFSWADNTVVEDEEAAVQSALSHYESIGDRENYSDVDAVASASVVAPGNTAKMAQWIQEYVGGELFPIVVTESYPDNYDECLERAADEKAENTRPQLANHLDNIDDYDVIFLGFPNWWYTVPMAVHSFLEEYDFSGKTVIPFCTHGTGGLASSIQDIKKDLPDSVKMLEPIGIYRPDVDSAQDSIDEWLDSIGYEKEN